MNLCSNMKKVQLKICQIQKSKKQFIGCNILLVHLFAFLSLYTWDPLDSVCLLLSPFLLAFLEYFFYIVLFLIHVQSHYIFSFFLSPRFWKRYCSFCRSEYIQRYLHLAAEGNYHFKVLSSFSLPLSFSLSLSVCVFMVSALLFPLSLSLSFSLSPLSLSHPSLSPLPLYLYYKEIIRERNIGSIMKLI